MINLRRGGEARSIGVWGWYWGIALGEMLVEVDARGHIHNLLFR